MRNEGYEPERDTALDSCESKAIRNDEAEIKAVKLLKNEISEENLIKLIALDYIETEGKYGKYQIFRDGKVRLHRIDKIGEKTRPLIWELCVMFSDRPSLPLGDKLLGIYLSISKDEDKFIEEANFRYITTIDEFSERREL